MSVIIALAALFWIYTLQNRINVLEKDVDSLLGKKPATVVQNIIIKEESPTALAQAVHLTQTVQQAQVTSESVVENKVHYDSHNAAGVMAAPVLRQQTAVPPTEFFVYTWFKEHTLIKVGALIFFLGAAWFVSYAISEGWISPALRISLGLVTGVVLYVIGLFRVPHNKDHGVVFTALGTGVVLTSIFAGQFLFSLFAPVVALLIMSVSIAYTVFVSVKMNKQWLSVMAAVAGLCAPLLTNAPEPDITSFMTYLTFLTAGFLTVVFFTQWRVVTAVLAIGISFFEVAAQPLMSSLVLWTFIIIFSLLFLTSVTISLVRSQKLEVIDIISLALIGFAFAYLASSLVVFDGLALFIAAVLFAGIGYVLHLRHSNAHIIALYASFASIACLLGTSFLLEGYSLLLALTIEITFAFCVLAYTQISLRALKISAAAFILPVTFSFTLFQSLSWDNGIWHSEALAIGTLAAALVSSFLWLREHTAIQQALWRNALSAKIGLLAFIYALIFLARIGSALPGAPVSEGSVFVYLLFGLFILLTFVYLLKRDAPYFWVVFVGLTFASPVALSLQSLNGDGWQSVGVLHPDAIGVYAVLSLLFTAVLASVGRYRRINGALYQRLSGSLLVAFVVYSFVVIPVFWKSLFSMYGGVVHVLLYVSYAAFLYILIYILQHYKLPVSWVHRTKIAWMLPVMLSLKSLTLELWDGAILQPHAAGLLVMLTLSTLLAIDALRAQAKDADEKKTFGMFSTALFIVVGFYEMGLVWLSAHVLSVSSDLAVAISLFVYTVVGLGMYVFGSSNKNQEIKYGGMVLLVIVVLRLGFYEIWIMEMFWRIVTFLGIGAMFMLAALLERKPVEPTQ